MNDPPKDTATRPSDPRGWLDMATVHPARAMILLALGAILGLVIAGVALFTAKGTSTLHVPPEDVALVNQQPISRVDYINNLRALFDTDLAHATAQQRARVLNDMIREELFVQRAAELDVAGVDPAVRTSMVNAIEQQAAADAITSVPSESKLLAYFAAHQARYSSEGTMILRDFVFPSSSATAAAQTAQAIRAGARPVDQIAARRGARDSGRVNGEEFYFAAQIHLGDALFDAARRLPSGGVSSPIGAADGIHVLYMVRNLTPAPLDFASARRQVLEDFRNASGQDLLSGNERFLRQRANILIAKDVR